MRAYVSGWCFCYRIVLHGAHASVYAFDTVAVPSHDIDVIIPGVQLIPVVMQEFEFVSSYGPQYGRNQVSDRV